MTPTTTAAHIEFEKHRFDFSPSIVDDLTDFTALHLHDNNKTFKAAWQEWIQDPKINIHLTQEIERLHHLGFQGDVLQKMYASARYYLRKKLTDNVPEPVLMYNTQTSCPRFSREFLQKIDDDALQQIDLPMATKPNQRVRIISQAEAYAAFCNSHQTDIYQEFVELAKQGPLPPSMVHKLKKTYKRRFYEIRTKIAISRTHKINGSEKS